VAVSAIEKTTGIPVIGIIKRYRDFDLLPSRHLGLYTPEENRQAIKAVEFAAEIVEEAIDFEKFFEIAGNFEYVEGNDYPLHEQVSGNVKVAYFDDRAFSFYYPENLEALERAGAELIKMSAISDTDLHDADALYIGGGFPETNVKALCENEVLMKRIKHAVKEGLPVYAECGGLMYLSHNIIWDGNKFQMCGVLPFDVKMHKKPQGHGYVEALVDKSCGFFEKGEMLLGHEFHYSGIENKRGEITTVLDIKRGKGAENGRDGYVIGNVFASYLHIHAGSAKNWAENFVKVIKKNKDKS
jgi:cobyrinic acid a,c-diamide synthase